MISRIAAAMLALSLVPLPSELSAFEWLYGGANSAPVQKHRPSAEPRSATLNSSKVNDHASCISAIKRAEVKYGIPENLLLAVGLQEAGLKRDGVLTIWPWTINSEGVGSRFDSKQEALAYARSERAAGRMSFDVGCMQINMRWHGKEFDGLEDAFDPERNADYAARFLRSLRSETQNWMTAAGNYHSKTPQFHNRYIDGIERNLLVAKRQSSQFETLALQTNGIADVPGRKQENIEGTPTARTIVISPTQSLRASLLRPGAYSRQQRRIALNNSAPDQGSPDRADNSGKNHHKEARLTGAWWTSELSQSNSDRKKRTIYSQENIQPVLPNLRYMTPLP